MTPRYDDSELNALIDGELSPSDAQAIIARTLRDPRLAARLNDLRTTKALVQSAYARAGNEREKPAASGRRPAPSSHWLAAACLAGACVAIGWLGAEGYRAYAGLPGQTAALAQPADRLTNIDRTDPAPDTLGSRLLFHVSENAEHRFFGALDSIEALLVRARENGRHVSIELIANAEGVQLLRSDRPATRDRLAGLQSRFPEFQVRACRQTLDRLTGQGEPVLLAPTIRTDATAVDQIVSHLQQGWRYIRI